MRTNLSLKSLIGLFVGLAIYGVAWTLLENVTTIKFVGFEMACACIFAIVPFVVTVYNIEHFYFCQ